jgi:hypothetical protein
MTIGISGIQAAQRGNAELMAKFKPGGSFSKAIWRITMSLHRYAVSITHVVTGSLRGSHRMKMVDDITGRIYIDRSSVNPKNRQRPYVYGSYEEERGGEHAFYQRTVDEASGPAVQKEMRGFI